MGSPFCNSLCHSYLSHIWCSIMFFSSISTFSLSFHLYFGRPLLLCPGTSIFITFNIVFISSHHMPKSFQSSFLHLQATFTVPLINSFLTSTFLSNLPLSTDPLHIYKLYIYIFIHYNFRLEIGGRIDRKVHCNFE